MLRLYNFPSSGNCYKIRLLLNQINIPFEKIDVDIVKGESRKAEFINTKNIHGKVPVLEVEPGKFLTESNVILLYLSENTPFLPNTEWEKLEVLRWLFFEQNSLEPCIGTVRYWLTKLEPAQQENYRGAIEQKMEQGYRGLSVIESHLSKHQFFVAKCYTIADICLFGYTHVAEEGGFDLNQFPAVKDWIERVKIQPNYISITE